MSSVGLSGTTPSWPSLYPPGIELLSIPHHNPIQPGGAYLTHPIGELSILCGLGGIYTHLCLRRLSLHTVLDPNFLYAHIPILWPLCLLQPHVPSDTTLKPAKAREL
jgi:hypothetical protein